MKAGSALSSIPGASGAFCQSSPGWNVTLAAKVSTPCSAPGLSTAAAALCMNEVPVPPMPTLRASWAAGNSVVAWAVVAPCASTPAKRPPKKRFANKLLPDIRPHGSGEKGVPKKLSKPRKSALRLTKNAVISPRERNSTEGVHAMSIAVPARDAGLLQRGSSFTCVGKVCTSAARRVCTDNLR